MIRVLERILDFFFPPKCAFCHELLPGGMDGICDSCARELLRAEPIEKTGEFFSGCVAAFAYKDRVRESILRFKFSGRQEYAAVYAPLLAACIQERLAGQFDVITWVPVSARRRRKRGYDQAQLLAEQTAKVLNVQAVPMLKKIRHTPAQSTLREASRRKANVLGAYQAIHAESLTDRRVLLIDDVATTGATLSECSRVLRTAGAKEVVCAALAATGQTKG